MLFNWAILVLNDKVKGKGINGNLRHIYWEKNNAVGRSATSNQNVASFLLCSTGVLQLSLPPCSSGLTCESTFRNTGGHTHTHQSKLSSCWNWTETGHPLRLDCKLKPKFSKTETYKHMNSSQALLEHCGQQTCWVRQAAQPKNLWHSCRIAIHAQIVGEANAQIPKFSDSCLCWTPSSFFCKKNNLYSVIPVQPICLCHLVWHVCHASNSSKLGRVEYRNIRNHILDHPGIHNMSSS